MVFVALLCSAFGWVCEHDRLQKTINMSYTALPTRKWRLLGESRQNIRVFFDYTYIDNPERLGEGLYCSKAGDSVNWRGDDPSGAVACLDDDTMTDEKKNVIKGTFENLKTYLESTIKVDRVTGSYTLTNSDKKIPVSRTTTDGNTDLYITLYPRPFGQYSSTLASAGAVALDRNTNRPIQGQTNINLAKLPKTVGDFSTVRDREFFEVALHETCHVLGIGGGYWRLWLNQEGKPWGENVPLSTFTKDGKTFNILHTPKLHNLMKARWGVEYFENNVPAGVEIEDSGGSGTTGSHWELRTFMNELMVGTTLGYSRISEVTLTALEDTGWYDVDYSRAEPLEWGDYRSIIGGRIEDFKDFATGRPVETWPSHYLAKTVPSWVPSDQQMFGDEGCTFDHKAVAAYSGTRRNCQRVPAACEYTQFYDPNNHGFYGSYLFDYLMVYQPASNALCFKTDTGNASRYSMCAREKRGGVGTYGGCHEMSCEDNKLFIHVGGASHECAKENMEINLETKIVLCPDPNVVCGILQMSRSGGGGGKSNNGKTLTDGAIAAIVIVVLLVVGAGVVLGVLFAMGKLRRKPKIDEDIAV